MTNFRLKATDNATGLAIRYVPSKAAFEGRDAGLNLIAGDNTLFLASNGPDTPGNFNLGFTPFIINAGQIIDFEIVADSMDILGNSSGIPFLFADAHDGPRVSMEGAVRYIVENNDPSPLSVLNNRQLTVHEELIVEGDIFLEGNAQLMVEV